MVIEAASPVPLPVKPLITIEFVLARAMLGRSVIVIVLFAPGTVELSEIVLVIHTEKPAASTGVENIVSEILIPSAPVAAAVTVGGACAEALFCTVKEITVFAVFWTLLLVLTMSVRVPADCTHVALDAVPPAAVENKSAFVPVKVRVASPVWVPVSPESTMVLPASRAALGRSVIVRVLLSPAEAVPSAMARVVHLRPRTDPDMLSAMNLDACAVTVGITGACADVVF